jgi:hypothetical protein
LESTHSQSLISTNFLALKQTALPRRYLGTVRRLPRVFVTGDKQMYRRSILLALSILGTLISDFSFASPTHGAGNGGPQKICFQDGTADYKKGGAYQYTTSDGKVYTGHWQYIGQRQYMITFNDGRLRVDIYQDDGSGQFTDTNPSGRQFVGHLC